MRKKFLLSILTGGIAACQGVQREPTINSGGELRAFMEDVRQLNERGATKVITGTCASACTIYLGVRKACVEPSARLWFHAAHRPNDNEPDALGSLQMLSYYPPKVREWAMRVNALGSVDFERSKMLTGEQLILMGVAPCVR